MEALFSELRQKLQEKPARMLQLPGLELRESAVLVPLFVREGQPHALFTRRPAHLRQHGGQISFPGGTRDPEDATPLHTALRETQEELGIPPEKVEILGMLDEVPTSTQFRIIPFVGAIPPDFKYVISPEEIAEVIEVPLAHLLNPAAHRAERRGVLEAAREICFYDYGPNVIWGATARILRNLLQHFQGLPTLDPSLQR